MRLIITILLFISYSANANTYYVSNAGSNANNGTSTGTSWQTISKVNGFSFTSGDSILFKCGDSWSEQLLPPVINLYFGSYSTGNKPSITGLVTQTGFSNLGSNVWSASTGYLHHAVNVVLINGNPAYKARYPNTGSFLTYIQNANPGYLSTYLTGDTSHVGEEVCVRLATYVWDVCKVKLQTTGTLSMEPLLSSNTNSFAGGYFFQNAAKYIDAPSEYFFDSSTGVLSVYSVGAPTVQFAMLDTLVKAKQGTVIQNISITGANKVGVLINNAAYSTVNNSVINNCNNGLWGDSSAHVSITNDSIVNSNNNGLTLALSIVCPNALISGNYIKNAGTVPGMGQSSVGTYTGLFCMGDSGQVTNNTIENIGFNGVHWLGRNYLIENNYLHNTMLAKSDGGAIYTWQQGTLRDSGNYGAIIRGNIIDGAFGYPGGLPVSSAAFGIYLDDNSHFITVSSNIVKNCFSASLYLHYGKYINFYYNYLEDSVGLPIWIGGTTSETSNLDFKGNVFYSRSPTVAAHYTQANITQTSDSNYYLRPTALTGLIFRNGANYSYPSTFVSSTGFDAHGGTTPTSIIGNVGTLFFNPTNSDSTLMLPTTYKDVYGNVFFGKKILHAHSYFFGFPFIYQYTESNYYLIPH